MHMHSIGAAIINEESIIKRDLDIQLQEGIQEETVARLTAPKSKSFLSQTTVTDRECTLTREFGFY